MKSWFIWALLCFNYTAQAKSPFLLFICLDGYRFDYTDLHDAHFLKAFAQYGVQGKSLKPIYPSKTFPNHMTLVTGVFASQHQILANQFVHPISFQEFSLFDNSKRDPQWYTAEPLWSKLENAGIKTASYQWPASDYPTVGKLPSLVESYKKSTLWAERKNTILKWLQLPLSQQPQAVFLYISDIDEESHRYGTHAQKVKDAISKVCIHLPLLIKAIESQLYSSIHTIIVSDHGMQNLDNAKLISIEDKIPLPKPEYVISSSGAQMFLNLKDKSKLPFVNSALKKQTQFQTYLKEEIPLHYNLRSAQFLPDLLLTTEYPNYLVTSPITQLTRKADHGYDATTHKSMHGIFYAQGPQFHKNKIVDTISIIHIAPLILKLFNLPGPTLPRYQEEFHNIKKSIFR